MKQLSFFLLAAFYALPVQADQPIDLIHVLCMQEKGMPHFSVSVDSFAEAAEYIHSGKNASETTTKEDRINNLRKYGLIYPVNFSYECQLPESKYRIEGNEPPHQAKGMCGGDPRITLSIYKDDRLLLDNIYLTPSCFTSTFGETKPYISRIVVDEGIEGWGDTWIGAYISNADNIKYLPVLTQYNDVKKFRPITQKYLDCIVRNGFYTTNEQKALKDCYE